MSKPRPLWRRFARHAGLFADARRPLFGLSCCIAADMAAILFSPATKVNSYFVLDRKLILNQDASVGNQSPTVKAIQGEMERREMNALELSKLADVSYGNLYAIFRGDSVPTIETIEKLAKALRMKITVT